MIDDYAAAVILGTDLRRLRRQAPVVVARRQVKGVAVIPSRSQSKGPVAFAPASSLPSCTEPQFHVDMHTAAVLCVLFSCCCFPLKFRLALLN